MKIKALQTWQLLLVGNNPIELSSVVDRLKEIRHQPIVTQFAFDLKSSLQCLNKFVPSYILIDDNIGRDELKETVHKLAQNRKTKDVPITIIKNSNYQATIAETPLDFVLKSNLSPDRILKTLNRSATAHEAQAFLKRAYQKRKGLLSQLLSLQH
jgi:CheY-like chemotaxis protein